MSQPERLAAFLRGVMDAEFVPDPNTLRARAKEFAELCEATNERLSHCAELLKKGYRTEAIHLAEEPPPLLEQAVALDFYGFEAWRQFCQEDRHLAAPVGIARQAVALLNEAYVKEDSLSELMAEWRRVALVGTLRQKIATLRRLAKRDNARIEDLKEFERARIEELGPVAAAAVGGDDLGQLEALRSELSDDAWRVKPNSALVQRVDQRIAELQTMNAALRGRAIASEAWDAYEAKDFYRTDSAVQNWNAIVAEGLFRPSADMQGTLDEILQWHRSEAEGLAARRAYKHALQSLVSALDSEAKLNVLERLLFDLERNWEKIPTHLRDNLQIPGYLRDRALRAIHLLRQARARRIRLTITLSLAAALILMVLTGLFVKRRIDDRRRDEWARQIQRAIEANDYEAASRMLGALRERHPNLREGPPFPALAEEIESEWAVWRERRRQTGDVLQELDAIRQQNFPEDLTTNQLEAAAATLAETESERMQLEDWRLARQIHEARRQEERDQALMASLRQAGEAFGELEGLDPAADRHTAKAYKRALDRIDHALEQGRQVRRASEEVTSLLEAYFLRFGRLKEAHRKAVEIMDEQDAMAEALMRPAGSLEEYERRLRTLVDKYPNNDLAQQRNGLLASFEAAQDAVSWGNWDVALGGDLRTEAEAFLSDPDNRDSLWRVSAERIAALSGEGDDLSAVKDSLSRLRQNWRFSGLYTLVAVCRDSNARFRYYYREIPQRLGGIRGNDREFYEYSVSVFEKGDQPEVKRFDPREFKLEFDAQDPANNLAPHVEWLSAFMRRVRNMTPEDAEQILLEGAEELRLLENADPIVKAILLCEILDGAREMSIHRADEIQELASRLAPPRIQTNVNWLNPRPNAEDQTAKDDIASVLEAMHGIGELLAALDIERSLHRAALSLRPRFLGKLENGAGGLKMQLTHSNAKEAWTVIPAESALPQVRLVALRDGSGDLRLLPEELPRLVPGQILLGPQEGQSVRAHMARIFDGVDEAQWRAVNRRIVWPGIWPANARRPGFGNRQNERGD